MRSTLDRATPTVLAQAASADTSNMDYYDSNDCKDTYYDSKYNEVDGSTTETSTDCYGD